MTITWEDLSRGFHGGRFESYEIETFNLWDYDSDEIQKVQFTVQEYTSDEEDFFGVACPKWEIILTLTDIREPEYRIKQQYLIGRDYARANYAQDFCEYVVESITKYGNLSRLPLSEFVD